LPEPIDARGLMTDHGAGRYVLDPAAVIGIAIHHSVSGGQFYMAPAPSQDDELSHLIMIDQYHASKGWGGFAYHLAAFPSGRLYLCGNVNGARAHVASRNNELIGLVCIGTFTDVAPPPPLLAAAAAGVAYIWRTYPGRMIGPHREWALPEYPTTCPGDVWLSWAPQLAAPPIDGSSDLTPDESRKLNDLWNWVSSGDASPYRLIKDPRNGGSLWVVAFGKRRHIVNMAALTLSGYRPGEIEDLPAAAGPGVDWAAAFDSIPEF